MTPNYQRITNFLENKPGYGIAIIRGREVGSSAWTLVVFEPLEQPVYSEPFRHHVHVDEDTDFDTALDIVERYISDKFHGRLA